MDAKKPTESKTSIIPPVLIKRGTSLTPRAGDAFVLKKFADFLKFKYTLYSRTALLIEGQYARTVFPQMADVFKELRYLKSSGGDFSPESLNCFLSENTYLFIINLSCFKVDEPHIYKGCIPENLTHIRLSDSDLGEMGFTELMKFIGKNLNHLQLLNSEVGETDLRLGLGYCSQLKKIKLDLKVDCLPKNLYGFLANNPNIEEINLTHFKANRSYTYSGKAPRKLTHIIISNSNFGKTGFSDLMKFIGSTLIDLKIENSQINIEDLKRGWEYLEGLRKTALNHEYIEIVRQFIILKQDSVPENLMD